MKKLMYLLVAGILFVFVACNSGTGDATATEDAAVEEVVVEEAATEATEETAEEAEEETAEGRNC